MNGHLATIAAGENRSPRWWRKPHRLIVLAAVMSVLTLIPMPALADAQCHGNYCGSTQRFQWGYGQHGGDYCGRELDGQTYSNDWFNNFARSDMWNDIYLYGWTFRGWAYGPVVSVGSSYAYYPTSGFPGYDCVRGATDHYTGPTSGSQSYRFTTSDGF